MYNYFILFLEDAMIWQKNWAHPFFMNAEGYI